VNNRGITWLLCGLAALSACELIADFDQDKLNDNRTIGVTPLPTLDGAVAVVPDGSLRADGALTRDDAGTLADGATPGADAAAPDASHDPDADAAPSDAGLDAAAPVDAGTASGQNDAMVRDADLELFADV